MKLKETEIETEILIWLNAQPSVFAFKIETRGYYDARRGFYRKNKSKFVIPGTSDIIGSWYGRLLAVEVKTPDGIKVYHRQNTDHVRNQFAFIKSVQDAGGLGVCVSSLKELQTFLHLGV